MEKQSLGFEYIFKLLNELETYEKVAARLGVSDRTVRRIVKGKAERHWCWRRIVTVDATSDVPASNGARGK